MKKTQLVETLVKTGLVSEAVMTKFATRAQAEGQNPIKLLLEEGTIDEHTFVQSAGLQLGIPPVYLEHIRIPSYIAKLISREIAEKWCTIPITLKREGGKEVLYCAFLDPTDEEAMEEIKQLTGKPVKPVLSGLNDIHNAINRSFVKRRVRRPAQDSSVSGVHEQSSVPPSAQSLMPPMQGQPPQQSPSAMPPMQPSAPQTWNQTPPEGQPTGQPVLNVEQALTPPPSQSGRIKQLRQSSGGIYRVPTGEFNAQSPQPGSRAYPSTGEWERQGQIQGKQPPSTGVFPQEPDPSASGAWQRRATPPAQAMPPSRSGAVPTSAYPLHPGASSGGFPATRASNAGFPAADPNQPPTGPYHQRPAGAARSTPSGVPTHRPTYQSPAPRPTGQYPQRPTPSGVPRPGMTPPPMSRPPMDAYAEAWTTPEPGTPSVSESQVPLRTTPSGLNRAQVQDQIQDVLSVLESPPEPGTFDRSVSGRYPRPPVRGYERDWVDDEYAQQTPNPSDQDSDNLAFDIPRAPAFNDSGAVGQDSPNMTHQWLPSMGAKRVASKESPTPSSSDSKPSKRIKELNVDDTGAISLPPSSRGTKDGIVTSNFTERKLKTQRIARGGGITSSYAPTRKTGQYTQSIPGRNVSDSSGANPLFEDFDRLLNGALSETKSRLEEDVPDASDSVWTETKIRRQIDDAAVSQPSQKKTDKQLVTGYASPNGPGRSGSISVDEFQEKTTSAAMAVPTFPVEDGLSQRVSQEVFNELVQLVRLAMGRNTVDDGQLIESFLQGGYINATDPDMAALHRILAGRVRQMIQHGQISDPIIATRFQ